MVFNAIQERWGKCDIDLFASRPNFKVPQYVSRRPNPWAQFINALLMNWKPHNFYAFPPFSLLATCLQKVVQDQSTGILIVLKWTTQPWFMLLLNLLTDNPLVLPQTDREVLKYSSPQQCSSSSQQTVAINGLQSIRECIQSTWIS